MKADRLTDADLSLLDTEIDAQIAATSRTARDHLLDVVKQSLDRASDAFCDAMLAYPRGDAYLGNEFAQERFRDETRNWLAELFSLNGLSGEQIRRRQMEVGASYARLKIPVSLVMRGFRELKKTLISTLPDTGKDQDTLTASLSLMSMLLDTSLSTMATAYGRHAERVTRSDEALRQFSVGQDISVERERQRAAMLDWAQGFYFQAQLSNRDRNLRTLGRAEFGLWFTHRAEILLGRTSEYESAIDAIERCDDLVERLNFDINADHLEIISAVHTELETLSTLVSMMFDQIEAHNVARDPLTKLLNKQYLAPAVSREIALTQQGRPPFCLVAFSLGRLDPRRIEPDQQGWEDIVRRSAQIILSMTRSSDSVFRLNDYTILIVRVESTSEEANQLAEEAVLRLTAGHLGPAGNTIYGVKVRRLVMEYDGQPDPRQVIRFAEQQMHQIEELSA